MHKKWPSCNGRTRNAVSMSIWVGGTREKWGVHQKFFGRRFAPALCPHLQIASDATVQTQCVRWCTNDIGICVCFVAKMASHKIIKKLWNVLLSLDCRHGNIYVTGQCHHRQRRSVPLQFTASHINQLLPQIVHILRFCPIRQVVPDFVSQLGQARAVRLPPI